MTLSLIAAIAENGVIGEGNDLPWHLPEDLQRFKKITSGHPVLMGRKTFESIMARLGTPLPNRTNIVLTRQSDYPAPDGVKVYDNLEAALNDFADQDIFCIGGAQLFEATLNKADKLFLTHVKQTFPNGDAFFPALDAAQWKPTLHEEHEKFTFVDYVKR